MVDILTKHVDGTKLDAQLGECGIYEERRPALIVRAVGSDIGSLGSILDSKVHGVQPGAVILEKHRLKVLRCGRRVSAVPAC